MDTRVKGNLHVQDYIYKNCESDFYDTVGDCREYSSAGVTYQQKCTVANDTKGSGTWVNQPSGSGASDITALTNSSTTETTPNDAWYVQMWVSLTDWRIITWANVKSALSSIFFKLDQTAPQTISNGTPSLNRTIDQITDPKHIVTKEYVDMAVQALHLDEYFSDVASDIGGIYKVMTETPAAAGTVVSAAITSNTTTNVFNFATVVDSPHLDRLLAGNYDIHAHLLKTGNRTIVCYCELYKRTGATETLLGTTSLTPSLTSTDTFYDLYLNIPTEIALLTTDRLVLKWYATSSGAAGNTTVTMTVGGTADPHISIDVNSLELGRIYAYKELSNTDISGNTEKTSLAQTDMMHVQEASGAIKMIKGSVLMSYNEQSLVASPKGRWDPANTTVDGSDLCSQLTDTGSVGTYHFLQATAGLKPLRVVNPFTGNYELYFNGANNMFMDFGAPIAQPCTYQFVIKLQDTGAAQYIIFPSAAQAATYLHSIRYLTTAQIGIASSTNVNSLAGAFYVPTNYFILTTIFSGTSSYIFINNNCIFKGSPGVKSIRDMFLFCDSAAGFAKGYFADMIMYDTTALTPDQIYQNNAYWAKKHKLVI